MLRAGALGEIFLILSFVANVAREAAPRSVGHGVFSAAARVGTRSSLGARNGADGQTSDASDAREKTGMSGGQQAEMLND